MPGLLVNSTDTDGKAHKIGVKQHDVLYKYNDTILNSVDDLITATQSGQSENELVAIRGSEILNLSVAQGSLGVSVLPYSPTDATIAGVSNAIAKFENEKTATAQAAVNAALENILVTTTPSIEGYRVIKTIEVVTAECVYGINLFLDFFAALTDTFGGRSGAMQKALRDARKTCLAELKKEALLTGANAVIGVDLDYSEISGGGKSMLFLVASGTAVIIEPIAKGGH
ncbi:MAG: hypothetical protein CO070_01440 [Gallionellales bacterium CG_4_9_14_0_8_um_filter_55_61]|nr:MAG: hypothetical protein CO070_01440 [Gallionellales bacterium CG_4_9_14_0_8_um_filter_55_61]